MPSLKKQEGSKMEYEQFHTTQGSRTEGTLLNALKEKPKSCDELKEELQWSTSWIHKRLQSLVAKEKIVKKRIVHLVYYGLPDSPLKKPGEE